MKSILLTLAVCLLLPCNLHARDHMVSFVGELYRQEQVQTGPGIKKYHALQVDHRTGSKLLVLTGEDDGYRNWLRQYLASHDRLVIKVPDEKDDAFRRSMVFEIDVTDVHPVFGDKWHLPDANAGVMESFKGQKHILIVDGNDQRRKLMELVVKNSGYPVSVSDNGSEALQLFRLQPDKFSMVIADAGIEGLEGADLVRQIRAVEPDLPVILGTGYRNRVEKKISAELSGLDRLVVTPLLLQELPRKISRLLGDSV